MEYGTTQTRNVAVLAVPLLLVASLGLSGCDSTTDTSIASDANTITTNAKASFAGKVVDINGDPISGAGVALMANTKYTATTDASGNYLIEVDLGDITASSGGGSGGADGGDNIDGAGDWVYRDFPMEISMSGFTTFRHVVEFEGLIGYTDGSGAVVLISQLGAALPQTVLVPYVDSFSFTVYAGDSPAAGAVVTLFGSENSYPNTTDYNSSNYFLTGLKTFVANSSGVVTISETNQIPANGYYSAVVAPFDAAGDGQYEYEATYASSIFNLDADRTNTSSMIHDVDGNDTWVQSENSPRINLRDGSNDIALVYLSINDIENIPVSQAAGFSIMAMFNRPVLEETLADMQGPLFSLKSNNDNMPVPFTVTNVGGYLYTITPDITLDPARNYYMFRVNDALAYNGGVDTDSTQYASTSQQFVIYDPNATLNAAIIPGLDIDEDSTYKVDYNRFLVGDMTVTNPLTADTSQGSLYNDDLRISFLASSGATGYQVWVKDSNSPWINVDDDPVGSLSYTYNDGQAVEVTVNNIFSTSFAGGEFVSPTATSLFREALLDDNELQVVVMPENINGFATDPNSDATIAGLTLSDNWGPEVVTGTGFDGTATEFNASTMCDAMGVNVAVHEPLTSVPLTPEFTDPLTEFGARAVTGSPCFTVSGVRFPDQDLVDPATDTPYPSNFGYIEVDLAPVLSTTTSAALDIGDVVVPVVSNAGFASQDSLRVGDTTNETLYGFIGSTNLITDGMDTAEVSGSDVYWRGPVQNGYASVTGTLPSDSDTYDQFITVASSTGVDTTNGAVLTSGQRVTSKGTDFGLNTGSHYLFVDAPLTSAISPSATVSGYNLNQVGACNTTLAGVVAIGDTTITVADATACAVGDVIVIGFSAGTVEIRTISAVAGAVLTVSALTAAHAIGDSVDEGVAWSTTAFHGYPLVYLGSTIGMKPGSSLTFTNAAGTQTDTVTVNSLELGYAALSDIPTAGTTAFGFVTGDSWSNNSSRSPDALEVQLQDRSGNDSDDTDTDGDGVADYDQLGYETVDGTFGRF